MQAKKEKEKNRENTCNVYLISNFILIFDS